MPRLWLQQPVDYHKMEFGPPRAKPQSTARPDRSPTGYTLLRDQRRHRYIRDPGSQADFIPQKFYELEMRKDFVKLNPALPGKTRFFGFHETTAILVSQGR